MVDRVASTRSGAQAPKSNPRRKAIRSHTGCITCRARKVKCDERPGICLNCERLHLECQRANDSTAVPSELEFSQIARPSSPPLGEVGIKRKRTFRSCTQCRSSKARCSGDRPSCKRCIQRTVTCVYDEDSEPQWTRVVQSARQSDSQKTYSSSDSNNAIAEKDDAIGEQQTSAAPCRSPSIKMSIEQPARQSIVIPDLPQPPVHPSLSLRRSTSLRPSAVDEGADSLEWLFKSQLPNRQRIRMLVKEYFENIHPLRCYAFIHRPSFLQRLEESSTDDHARNGLLHVVCALGAKFYALQYDNTLRPLSSRRILSAGNDWAKKAMSLLFSSLSAISVQNLMTAVLLHDHELRIGNYAGAFVLTGVITRMAQALQLNLEFSNDLFHDEPNNGPTVCSKEARRRLMWSCYISDTLIGSGVDQLTLLNERDIKIQLPCNERNFVLQVPCVTEILAVGQFLPFVAPELIPPRVIDNIGIVALYIRLISLRKQVLRYIKRLDISTPPWLPDSEFAKLDNALHEWYLQLPPSLQFTRAALYTRRESSQLGAFVLLQCTYNWTTVDLYRIAMPKLYRLRPPWQCSDEFRARLQETIFVHAQRCSTVLADASRHGIKTLADTWLPSIAFDGNRLMLYYITQILGFDTERGQVALADCMPYCRSNLELLSSMRAISAMADSLYPIAEEMLKKATTIQQATKARARDDYSHEDGMRTRETTPDRNGPDYILQPTTIYRMARDSITTQEKHASEKSRAQRLRTQAASAPTSPALASPVNPAGHQYPAATRAQPPGFNTWADSPSTTSQLANYNQGPNLIQLEPTAPAMHEFDTFLSAPGFDSSWQPQDTATTAMDGGGLPPWLPAMTDMYADINFGPWPLGTDLMNGHPSGMTTGADPSAPM